MAQDIRDVLHSMGSAGRSSIKRAGADEIRRLIESQPDIEGPVTINGVRGNDKVGASSGIVLFTAAYRGADGPVERDYVLRHAPTTAERLFLDYDMSRQFRVQKALQGSGVPVPDPLWLDAEGEHLGAPGFVMERTAGDAPSPAAFVKGPIAEASPADREAMLDQAARSLARVHNFDFAAAGLSDFAMDAPGDGGVERYVNWLWRTWEWIDVAEYARLVPVYKSLVVNAPRGKETLIHGDSSLHNYLFAGNRVTAMLDWEQSSVSRPEADLALQILGNRIFAAPGAIQPPSDEQWLERYARMGGRPLDPLDYYIKLSCYLVIVCVIALERNLPEEVRAAQRPFTDMLWNILES